MRAFVTWLSTGLAPSVTALGSLPPAVSKVTEATESARLAAVVSFYRYHHDVHGRGVAIARASAGPPRRGRYRPMLVHLSGRRRQPSSALRLGRSPSGPPPLLSPAQVASILDGCATFDAATGEWRPSLRDRLLFATLVETGMFASVRRCA